MALLVTEADFKRSYDHEFNKIKRNTERLLATDVTDFKKIRIYHSNITLAINTIQHNNSLLASANVDMRQIEDLSEHTIVINKSHLWFLNSAQIFVHDILLKSYKRSKYKHYKRDIGYILCLHDHYYLSLIPAFHQMYEYLSTLNTKYKIPCTYNVSGTGRMQLWRAYFGDDKVGKCQCCGDSITFDTMTRGHVVAKYHGGNNDISNLRPVCYDCNQEMGTMHMDAYIKLKYK